MSASDNEFEQYSNELNDILSMGAAIARVRDPTNLFENLYKPCIMYRTPVLFQLKRKRKGPLTEIDQIR